MDCSLPGFSVHGIFQARVLEWVAISFSRGSSWLRDRTQVSRIVGKRFTLWATSQGQKVFGEEERILRRTRSSSMAEAGEEYPLTVESTKHELSSVPSF